MDDIFASWVGFTIMPLLILPAAWVVKVVWDWLERRPHEEVPHEEVPHDVEGEERAAYFGVGLGGLALFLGGAALAVKLVA